MEQQTAEGSRVAESVLPETDDDAVRIMTIHAAKGLEFPITIVTGLSARPGGQRSPVEVHFPKDGGPVGYRMGSQVVTDDFEANIPIDEQMGYDERLRLLYVACTRAMDHLVVSLHRADRKNPPDAKRNSAPTPSASSTAWVTSSTSCPTSPAIRSPSPLDPAAVPSPPPDFDAWSAERTLAIDVAARPGTVAATALTDDGAPDLAHGRGRGAGTRARCRPADGSRAEPTVPLRRARRLAADRPATPERRVGDDGDPGPLEPPRRPGPAEASGRPRPAAVAEGPLRHRGRSGRPRRAPDHRPRVRRGARRRRRRPVPGRGGARPRRRRAPASCVDALGVAVGASGRRRRRTGGRSTPARPIGDRLLEGYVDLLYRADDGLVVVDYKTSATADPAELDRRVEGYRLQGAAYAVAVGRATGEPVTRVVFLFLTPQGAVERELPDLAAAMADVERLVRAGEELVTC